MCKIISTWSIQKQVVIVQTKLDGLRTEADRLSDKHPDEAQQIQSKFKEMEGIWKQLQEMLKQREESLGEASNLQKFVRDLDQFQVGNDASFHYYHYGAGHVKTSSVFRTHSFEFKI